MPTVVSHSSSCLLCGSGPTEYKHEQLHKKVFGRQQGILLINSQRWSFLTWTMDSPEPLNFQTKTPGGVLFVDDTPNLHWVDTLNHLRSKCNVHVMRSSQEDHSQTRWHNSSKVLSLGMVRFYINQVQWLCDFDRTKISIHFNSPYLFAAWWADMRKLGRFLFIQTPGIPRFPSSCPQWGSI